jgi:hypothetical protein
MRDNMEGIICTGMDGNELVYMGRSMMHGMDMMCIENWSTNVRWQNLICDSIGGCVTDSIVWEFFGLWGCVDDITMKRKFKISLLSPPILPNAALLYPCWLPVAAPEFLTKFCQPSPP